MPAYLRVIREPSQFGTTLGSLYINGRWFCWTLEDEIREVPGQPVASWKVPRETAIPAGRYLVRLSMSNRFKRILPELLDVPGFVGVRAHRGNTHVDTEGCLIVGSGRTDRMVTGSAVAEQKLVDRLSAESGPIWLSLEMPIVEAP